MKNDVAAAACRRAGKGKGRRVAVNLCDSWVSVLNGKHLSLQSEFDSRSSFLDNITNAPAAYLDPTNHPPTPLDNRSFDKVRSILMYMNEIL